MPIKKITLTDFQVDFIEKAIDVKEAVIDFDLDEETWNECYPYSKDELLNAIDGLRKQLK